MTDLQLLKPKGKMAKKLNEKGFSSFTLIGLYVQCCFYKHWI